jgi:hypothetical protein
MMTANTHSGDDATLITDSVQTVLLRNATFYAKGPDDSSMYLIDVAAIAKLTYLILEYASTIFGAVLPVISGVSWMLERRKKKDAAAAGDAQLSQELNARLQQLRHNLEDQRVEEALTKNVAEMLAYHGWPEGEAATDARSVVGLIKSASSSLI